MTHVAEIPSVEVICAVKYKGNVPVLLWLGFEGNIRQKKKKKKIGVFTVNGPNPL